VNEELISKKDEGKHIDGSGLEEWEGYSVQFLNVIDVC